MLKGWTLNDGNHKVPEDLQRGTLVDVIHQCGKVHFCVRVGGSWAEDFSLDHDDEYQDGDIRFYRVAMFNQEGDRLLVDMLAQEHSTRSTPSSLDLAGWISNNRRNRVCPEDILPGALVDVIHRNGDIFYGESAGKSSATSFYRYGVDSDILYYRPSLATYKHSDRGSDEVGDKVVKTGFKIINALEA